MKTIKYIFSLCLIALLINSCVTDDDNADFVNTAVAPVNVMALFEVTQDNTGLVTITPTAEGAIGFKIYYGDDTVDPADLSQGEITTHTYAEGTYTVKVVAVGPTGLETEINQELVVSFNPPENLIVTAENDAAVSKQVNVNASADNAVSYTVDFGDGSELVIGNIGETVSYVYADPGLYTITVVVMGAAIETVEFVITDFEVTSIEQPLASAPSPPARAEADVISIFSSSYVDVPGTDYFPDWGQGGQGSGWALFNLDGDDMLQYVNLSYQGIALADGTTVDVSQMEYLHLDVWTAEALTDIEISLINNAGGTVTEAPVTSALTSNGWTSIEIPVSAYTDQGLTVTEIFQLKLVGTPWAGGTVFVDNIYFYKSPSTPSSIAGTWKVAPEAGSLAVGPTEGSSEWWSIDDTGVAERACYFDDTYVFGSDGSFSNVLGADTWIEAWQGVASDGCSTPVAPHDGSNAATYVHNETAGTLTLNGTGSYIGIPKANNSGELSNPVDAPVSITYNVTLLDINTMSVNIEAGSGVWWTFKLIRDGATVSPMTGTWAVAPEAGSLAVGPTEGSSEWWSIDDAGVAERACFYDDTFVFGSDGSFSNVLGSDTWVEAWQGVASDGCSAPVAPHDGSNVATYTYDNSAGTLTLDGTGAYLGIPKANNVGELSNPADAPASITYNVTFIDSNTISVWIEAGSGVFWSYKLIKI